MEVSDALPYGNPIGVSYGNRSATASSVVLISSGPAVPVTLRRGGPATAAAQANHFARRRLVLAAEVEALTWGQTDAFTFVWSIVDAQ